MPDPGEVKRIQERERARKLDEKRAKEVVLEQLKKLKREQKKPSYKNPPLHNHAKD